MAVGWACQIAEDAVKICFPELNRVTRVSDVMNCCDVAYEGEKGDWRVKIRSTEKR
jgi:hypothetical protein